MGRLLTQPGSDLQLWERFQSGRCSDEEIAGSVVLQRWVRCQRAGLSADTPGEPVMALTGLAESIDAFAPLLSPGAPFDAFATEVARAGFCGVFCDERGVVMSRRISEPFQSSIARTRLVEGAVWSEGARGTNGIGTTLEEQSPVAIIGTDHYEQRNHGLACYAAPVRDIRKRVVGVLDATGPVYSSAGFVHASVAAAAAALEALIVARTYDAAIPGGLFALERLLARLPHATLLVESTGHVRRSNARFRALMPGSIDYGIARLLGTRLASDASGPLVAASDLPSSMRGLSVELEPIGPDEDPFAAIVHMRPKHARRRLGAQAAPPAEAFAPIVGSDPAVAAARDKAERFARTDLPVLLLGETGAGKEIFARCIHSASARKREPFIAVNCGALTASLIESELFGYGPGAFTGAAPKGRAGKLTAAHEGTLFLDEVGELSPQAQTTLLRFLEDGTFYPVGESTERHADVRLIAATSRDLSTLVDDGRFRRDLYFRLRGVVLRLPPMRERNDRRELTLALLEGVARRRKCPKPMGLSRAALEWVERYTWPGNVRELRTALEYAVVLAGDSPRIEQWHLPLDDAPAPASAPGGSLRAVAEREALIRALDQSAGNLSLAARTLGVARSTLYRMLDRHELRPLSKHRG